MQPPALAEERRQPGGVRGGTARGARFQQQPAAVGMAGVVEDGDLVAVPGEDVEDLVEGGVGEQFEPAEAVALGILEDLLKPPEFLGQVPQITPALLLVGEGQDDDRQLGHDLKPPRGIIGHRIDRSRPDRQIPRQLDSRMHMPEGYRRDPEFAGSIL